MRILPNSKMLIKGENWRREWDSNPCADFSTRRFPGEPDRPLSHPSKGIPAYFIIKSD